MRNVACGLSMRDIWRIRCVLYLNEYSSPAVRMDFSMPTQRHSMVFVRLVH